MERTRGCCSSKLQLSIWYSSAFLCLGAVISSLGPALLELGKQTDSNVATMGWVFTARSAGYLSGSIIGGPIFDSYPGHRILSFSLFTSATATLIIPYLSHVALLGAVISVQGVTMGLLDTGGNVMLLWLWQDEVEPYMQALHASFGVGAFLAPIFVGNMMQAYDNNLDGAFGLLAVCFIPVIVALLYFDSPSNPNAHGHAIDTTASAAVLTEEVEMTMQMHHGGLDDDVEGMMFDDPVDTLASSSSSSSSNGKATQITDEIVIRKGSPSLWSMHRTEKYIICLVAMFLCLYVGAEVCVGSFIYTYIVNLELAHEHEAYYINAAFWGSFAFGRICSVFIATRVSAKKMLTANMIGTTFAILLILAFLDSKYVLWVGMIIYGFFMASSFPTAISLAERYVHVTGKMAAFFTAGAAMGEMVIPATVAQLMTHTAIGYHYLIIVELIVGLLGAIVVFELMRTGAKWQTNSENPRSHKLSSSSSMGNDFLPVSTTVN